MRDRIEDGLNDAAERIRDVPITEKQAAYVLLAFMLSLSAFFVVATFTDSSVEVSEPLRLQPSTSGPDIVFTNLTGEAELDDPFPDDYTIDFKSEDGNITIYANQSTSANVTSINGTWTNTTSMPDDDVNISFNPENKQEIIVNNTAGLNFTDVTLGDGNADIVTNSTGSQNITIFGLSSQGVTALDGNGNILDANAVTGGSATLTFDGSQTVLLEANDDAKPLLTNPQPEGRQDNYPTSISIDVEDDDFPNENVTVDFTHNGNDAGTDHVTSDGGTASVSVNADLGTNTVNATATDLTGNTVDFNWTYDTPENLTIRNTTGDHEIIDDRTINATFYVNDNITQKSTDNGNISMDGLPVKDFIVVSLSDESGSGTTDYYDVETLVIDFTRQTTAYMLNETFTGRSIRFTLEDRSAGIFENNNPKVVVERAINHSSWDSPRWEMVYSDLFGPDGTTGILQDGIRHRVKVRNDDNDVRSVGKIVPTEDETIPLSVGEIQVDVEDVDASFNYNVTYDDSGSTEYVRFYYNDTTDETDRIWLKIHEFKNESNVITTNQSFTGPYGTFSYSEPVPSDEENKSWVVDAVVVRDGENIKITEPAGDRANTLPGLSETWKALISIGTIILVAGLFSQLNGHFGGLVVAGLGGMFWWTGFLPSGTGIGVVVLAMIVAGILFLRERGRPSV